MNISEIRTRLISANEAYRTGTSIMSDAEYDLLKDELETLDENDPLINAVGYISQSDTRKRRLWIPMYSMNKIKVIDAFKKWLISKDIKQSTIFALTPKFDGISLATKDSTGEALTRGDGEYGQYANDHFAKLLGYPDEAPDMEFYGFGEAIMPRANFVKYSSDFANPRNMVAGLINNKEATEPLRDCVYMRYGLVKDNCPFTSKSEQLDYLNSIQVANGAPTVNYELIKGSDITEEYLKALFVKWNTDFELDGIIIEVNDLKMQQSLGRESNGNPAYARAYKGSFEEVKETEVLGIEWNVSKQGFMKPIVQVRSINLDGVNVTNVTGNNAKFVQNLQIGKGSILKLKRSGMVIPLIVSVEKSVPEPLPTNCSCGCELEWNENKVDLVCSNDMCDSKLLKRNIAFFTILGVDNVGEGVLTQFYDAGYTTIAQILAMSQADMQKLDRFGKRKAEIVFNAIHSKLGAVSISKLRHATGFFKSLGSKKLALLEHFEEKPTMDDVVKLDGFSNVLASSFLASYDRFTEFVKDLPITITRTQKAAQVGNDLEGKSFVFTGVRLPLLEAVIESRGGKISGSVSKNTTFLIAKDAGSGSSKITKAQAMGVTVLDVQGLETLLK